MPKKLDIVFMFQNFRPVPVTRLHVLKDGDGHEREVLNLNYFLNSASQSCLNIIYIEL